MRIVDPDRAPWAGSCHRHDSEGMA